MYAWFEITAHVTGLSLALRVVAILRLQPLDVSRSRLDISRPANLSISGNTTRVDQRAGPLNTGHVCHSPTKLKRPGVGFADARATSHPRLRRLPATPGLEA